MRSWGQPSPSPGRRGGWTASPSASSGTRTSGAAPRLALARGSGAALHRRGRAQRPTWVRPLEGRPREGWPQLGRSQVGRPPSGRPPTQPPLTLHPRSLLPPLMMPRLPMPPPPLPMPPRLPTSLSAMTPKILMRLLPRVMTVPRRAWRRRRKRTHRTLRPTKPPRPMRGTSRCSFCRPQPRFLYAARLRRRRRHDLRSCPCMFACLTCLVYRS